MTPEERRWKWVKEEALPDDLKELMALLLRKKTKVKETKERRKVEGPQEGDDEQGEEFITTVKMRNDHLLDYSTVATVKERLEVLK